jgi:hypothetical protein
MKNILLMLMIQVFVFTIMGSKVFATDVTSFANPSYNLGDYENSLVEQNSETNDQQQITEPDIQPELVSVAKIIKFNVDPQMQIHPTRGTIELHKDKMVLNLTEIGFTCMSLDCPPPPVKNYSYEVSILKVQKTSCGTIEYVGRENLIPVDGMDTHIQVVDNTKNRCKTLIALEPTEIKLEIEFFNRQDGKYIKSSSSFSAEMLKSFVSMPINLPL